MVDNSKEPPVEGVEHPIPAEETAADKYACRLESFAAGAAQEKFEQALLEVAANIDNPNANLATVRKVVLVFSFEPGKQVDGGVREVATEVTCQLKLASTDMPAQTTIFSGMHQGEMVLREFHPQARNLFPDEDRAGGPKPVDIDRD